MRLSRLGQVAKPTDSESRQLADDGETRHSDHGDGRRVAQDVRHPGKRVPELTVNAHAIAFIRPDHAWGEAGAPAAEQVFLSPDWKSRLDAYRKAGPAVTEQVVLDAQHGVAEPRGRGSADGLHKLAATIGIDPLALQAHSHEGDGAADIEPIGDADIARQGHRVRADPQRDRLDIERR